MSSLIMQLRVILLLNLIRMKGLECQQGALVVSVSGFCMHKKRAEI